MSPHSKTNHLHFIATCSKNTLEYSGAPQEASGLKTIEIKHVGTSVTSCVTKSFTIGNGGKGETQLAIGEKFKKRNASKKRILPKESRKAC